MLSIDASLSIILASVLAALLAMLMGYALISPMLQQGWPSATQPLPPRLQYWLWPWLQSLAATLPGSLTCTEQRLRRAGLLNTLTARHWYASQILLALFSVLAIALLTRRASFAVGGAGLAILAHELWLQDQIEQRRRAVLRDLPVMLDLLSMSLESGASLTSGLRAVVARLKLGPLQLALQQLLLDLRAGRSLAAALERLLEQLPYEALRPWAGLIAQSSHSGGNIAAQLRLQAQQRQEERFARAEKLAMQAPVKMLGPLLLCIFPCSFIVLATPILVRLLTTN